MKVGKRLPPQRAGPMIGAELRDTNDPVHQVVLVPRIHRRSVTIPKLLICRMSQKKRGPIQGSAKVFTGVLGNDGIDVRSVVTLAGDPRLVQPGGSR
jgi:hypothetical protein